MTVLTNIRSVMRGEQTPGEFGTKVYRRLTGRRPPVRDYPFRDIEQLLYLKGKELGAKTILDIGANAGQFALNLRELGWGGRIASFEPLSDVHTILARHAQDDPLWLVPPAMALGACDEERAINVSQNSLSSSRLDISERTVDVMEATRYISAQSTSVRRLDDVIPSQCEPPFAIKIDTQGFELEVLKGATRTLDQTVALTVELSLFPVYTGAPSFVEVSQLVCAAGFRCIALTEAFVDVARNEVLQIDATFVRNQV